MYGWFEVQLIARFGSFCRSLDSSTRQKLSSSLLQVAGVSVSAVNLLVGELFSDLSPTDQALALSLLRGWVRELEGRDRLRCIAVLAENSPYPIGEDLVTALVCSIREDISDDYFLDFEISGNFVDNSAPLVYPWRGLPVLVCQGLLKQESIHGNTSNLKSIEKLLWREADVHPSAVALLSKYYNNNMSRSRRQRLRKLRSMWIATSLPGNCEQAGLLMLGEDTP